MLYLAAAKPLWHRRGPGKIVGILVFPWLRCANTCFVVARQVNNVALAGLAPDLIAKRTKRHLDELEVLNILSAVDFSVLLDGSDPIMPSLVY